MTRKTFDTSLLWIAIACGVAFTIIATVFYRENS